MRLFGSDIKVEDQFELSDPEGSVGIIYYGCVRCGPQARLEPHLHANYEFFLMTEGACRYTVSTSTCILETGDVGIAKPGELHEIVGLGTVDWQQFYIAVDVERLPDISSIFHHSFVKRVTGCSDLEPIFARALDEARQFKLGSGSMIQSLFTILLVEIARRLGHSGIARSLRCYSDDTEAARIFIERNAKYKLSVNEVARAVGVSPGRLAHLFAAEMHTSVTRYARNVMMLRAARLLEEDRMNVSEIAAQLGFPSVHYFSASFKKHWGICPRDYRNNISA